MATKIIYMKNCSLIFLPARMTGSLVSRTSLRTLELDIENRTGSDSSNKSILKLFDCPQEKPNLEELVLHQCSLSTIYRFVNENNNLKSLILCGKINEKERKAVKYLLKILRCNSGLQEIKFWDDFACFLNPDLRTKFLTEKNVKTNRNEFQKLINDLENRAK